MSIQTITAPAAYPIDIAEAKLHLRVPFNNDDSLIRGWLGAACNYAENVTHKSLVTARFKQILDGFPGQAVAGIVYGQAYARPGNSINLERGPVLNVVSIQYLDLGGVVRTVGVDDTVNYKVDYASDPARITPVFGQIWPIPMPQIGAVWVNFDAGYSAKIIADATADTITVIGWPAMNVGDAVRLTNSGGALPAPLQILTDYYVKTSLGGGVYTLSAIAGGSQINLTDIGSGTNYLFGIPDIISAWLKLRMSAMYENREELAETPIITTLPFADRLLDGYRTWQF